MRVQCHPCRHRIASLATGVAAGAVLGCLLGIVASPTWTSLPGSPDFPPRQLRPQHDTPRTEGLAMPAEALPQARASKAQQPAELRELHRTEEAWDAVGLPMPPPNPYGMQTLWQTHELPGLTPSEACIVQSAVRPKGNTVLLSVTNSGMVALAVNLAQSLVKAGTQRFLIVALDDEAHETLQSHGIPTLRARPEWLDMRDADFVNTALGSEAEAKYREKRYNALTRVKHIIVRAFLVQGYTVFFHDVDIGYAGKNAVEELEEWVHSRHCSLALMTDARELDAPWKEWNTGLFIARPRWSTLFLLDGAAYGKGDYDQLAFTAHAQQHRVYRRPERHSILDTGEKMFCSIPNGKKWSTGNWACLPEEPLAEARLVHANWVTGAKKKAECLQKYGMWGVLDVALPRTGDQFDELYDLFQTLPLHKECASAPRNLGQVESWLPAQS